MSNELQQDLALLGELTNELRELDARLVSMCDTEQSAFRLCINQSKVYRTHAQLAELLGMSEGALTTVLNSDRGKRKRKLSRTEQEELQRVCQNTAIDQWATLYRTGMLNCQRTHAQQLAEAKALVARLESAA